MSAGALLLAGAGLRGRRRLGLVAASGVLLLAAVGLVAGLEVSRQGAPILDDAAAEANVAHLVLSGDAAAVASVAADPEVVEWSGPFTVVDGIELPVGGELVPMQLTALDSPDVAVGRPLMRDGRWVAADDEIVLDRSVGDDLGIAVGDTIALGRAGTAASFTVVGTAVSFTDCFYPQCDPGRAWVTEAGIARFGAGDEAFSQAWLRFDDPAQADPFVQRQAAAGVTGIGGTESWLDTREDFLTLDRVFGAFVAAFGVFVLVVAAVVIAGSTAMRVLARRREIGLLGAVGCTPGQITRGLLLENLAVGALAGGAGWGLGGLLVPSLQLGIGRALGTQDPSWTLAALVICVLTISLLLVAATIVPAWSAARRPVTDVLRDVPNDRVSRINRRTSRLPARLPLLGAQEVASRPTRAVLAALAIVVAVVGTIVSFGFVDGIDAVAAEPATAGDPWDVAVVPGDVAHGEVDAALAATGGVAGWFVDLERRSTFDGGAFLSVATGGDPGSAAYRIVEGQPLRGRGEAIVGYGFMERFGVDVGDEVDILVGTAPLHLRIVGWYRDTEDSGEILRYRIEDLAAVEPGTVAAVYRVSVADGADPAAVGAALAARLGTAVRIEVLDTGTDDLAPLLAALRLIAVVLLVMAGTNLLSTLLTSQREAAGRIGVQVAVGFTPRQVVAQGAVSGAVLGMVASVVAVPLGLLVFRLLSDTVSSSLGVGPGWMGAPSWAFVASLAAGAVALSAALGALAVRGIVRRPAAELVRSE